MSAIWGVITQSNDINIKQKEDKMRNAYSHCVIDRMEYHTEEQTAFGCGIQYFTTEAQEEELPIIDSENEIYFTADVLLDNREELLGRLGFVSDDRSIPDGRILFEMFHKYKEECLNEILGAYSFVYYDKKKKEIYLVADSTGTRCLHYFIHEKEIYFSTLIEPIVVATGGKAINERWITDFLALDNMALAISYEETPYQDIYRVPAAHYIKITSDKIKKVCYWNPRTKNIKYKSDEEYKARFKETFRECVKRLLRNKDVTMLLSGGLDSTSVACFAAKEITDAGKTLTSFTSIPEKDFQSKQSDYYVADESEAVLKTQDFLAQKGYKLECRFVDLAGRNSWDDRIDELKAMEIPYKSMQNLIWIKETMKQSYNMGARIMLIAGYGNITISNSFPNVYQYELVRKFRWIEYLKDSKACAQKYKIGRRKAIKITCKIFCNSIGVGKKNKKKDTIGNSLVNKELLKKYFFEERNNEEQKKSEQAQYIGKKAKELIKNDKVLYQIGETQTKHSLVTGVILRDPTINKRLIELCMSYPLGCYSKKGVTRRLVREYLAEELPEHVINSMKVGLQSADTVQRLHKRGNRVFDEIEEIFKRVEAKYYIDVDKALSELDRIKELDSLDNNFELLRLEYTAMVIEYVCDRIKDGRFVTSEM